MAGISAEVEIQSPGPREAWDGPLGGFGWAMAWLDYAVYTCEKAIVVLAMAIMVVIEFVYIVYENINTQRIDLNRWMEGAEGVEFPTGLPVLLLCVAGLVFALVGHTRLGRVAPDVLRPLWQRLGVTTLIVAALVGLSALSITVEHSSTFYLLLTTLLVAPMAFSFFARGKTRTGVGVSVVGVVLLGLSANVPEGYSWADDYALFMLMWMGFLGASMATKERSHIRLDFARKFCPRPLLPWFTALSDLAAASFVSLVGYFGYLYMFRPVVGRWYATSVPGELPDWVSVLAIPVAVVIIAARFLGRAVSAVLDPEHILAEAAAHDPIDDEDDAQGNDPEEVTP